DAERYQKLGADKDNVVITGNMKFDLTVPSAQLDTAKEWRATEPAF
ncbi:unnamed protein product, partial [marine sediment metagenome]